MVLRARSVSTSYASFEAELEGAILQHTGAVDYYLETAAPKWPGSGTEEHATPQKLHSVFLNDMNSSFWQAFTHSRGEISLFDDEPITMRAPCQSQPRNPHEAYNTTQLLRQSTKRRLRAHPLQVGECRLEQYLQQDLQRYMDMHEQLDSEALECEAAMLATGPQLQSRTSSNGSFVRLPEHNLGAADDDDLEDAAAPLAPAVAAAAAMAAVNEVFSTDGGEDALGSAAFGLSASIITPAAIAAAANAARRISNESLVGMPAAAHMQQQVPAAEVAAAAAEAGAAATAAAAEDDSAEPAPAPAARNSVPFEMEADEDIAAQKLAARARLAELEGTSDAATNAATTSTSLPAGKCIDDDDGSMMMHSGSGVGGVMEPGSVHSSLVPRRPRGLAGPLHSAMARAGGESCGKGDSMMFGPSAANMQHGQFFQTMTAGLVLCMVLLPALWGLQAWAGSGTAGMHFKLLGKLQSYGSYFYLPAAIGLLLYILRGSLLLQPPLLHFANPDLEDRYLSWSNSGKLVLDCMFQVLFLIVGSCIWLRLKHTGVGGEEQAIANTRTLLAVISTMGSGLPMVVLLLLRSVQYARWREQLLAGSRVCSIAGLLIMQLSLPTECSMQLPLSMPFVALAQLMGIACMQVRLATFVPCQVLHVLVLLLKTQAQNPLLHFVQLFGGGLCLPCLLLHSMELYSRKAFLATVVNINGKQKAV